MDVKYSSTLLVIYFFTLFVYVFYLYKKNAFKMNAEPLTSQQLFWAALIIPFSAFIIVGIICWYGKSLRLDSIGFDNFLSISKLPLALLSLCLPLGVVVNNVHRTIQTDKQIKEAERKNKADGFYSHRKNTIEMFENLPFKSIFIIDKKYKIEFENNYTTYKYCYPDASINSMIYDADEEFTGRIQHNWLSLMDKIKNVNYNSEDELLRHIHSIENLLDQIHRILLFKPFDLQEVYFTTYFDENGRLNTFRTKFKDEWSIKAAIYAYWHAYIIIIQAIGTRFDTSFVGKMVILEHYCHNQEEKLGKWEMFKTSRMNMIGIYSEKQN